MKRGWSPSGNARAHTCDRCDEMPIDQVNAPYAAIELCLAHTLEFTGWSEDEWNQKHAPFKDHVEEMSARAQN